MNKHVLENTMRKGFDHFPEAWRWARIGVCAGILGIGAPLVLGQEVRAQNVSPSTAGFQEGQLTSVREKTVYINGRMYDLSPNVSVMDDEGKLWELKRLQPGLEVLYYLKNGFVEKLVVVLPK